MCSENEIWFIKNKATGVRVRNFFYAVKPSVLINV